MEIRKISNQKDANISKNVCHPSFRYPHEETKNRP